MGENPAMSDPDVQHAREAFAQARAPGRAGDLPDRDGLSRRRDPAGVGVSREDRHVHEHRPPRADGPPGARPPGEARPDWEILQEIARRMGLDWNYRHPRDVFAEMRLAMPSLQGITWDRLEREGAVTYPCDAEDQPGHEVIFGDGFPTADRPGQARPRRRASPRRDARRDLTR